MTVVSNIGSALGHTYRVALGAYGPPPRRPQGSEYGRPIAIVYGVQRVTGNIILSGMYLKSIGSAYGYSTWTDNQVQVAICEGPIVSVANIWKQKTKNTPAGWSITIQTGAGITAWSAATAYVAGDWASSGGTNYQCILGHTNHAPPNATYWIARGVAATERAQSAWSYLTSTFPKLALGYGGTAIASTTSAFSALADGGLERASFEVNGILSGTAYPSSNAANAAEVLVDLLMNTEYGLSWPSSRLHGYTASSPPTAWGTGPSGAADSSYYRLLVCSSWGLGLAIEQQRPAREIIEEVLAATDSTCIWSEGKLKIIPLTWYSKTDGSVTYTPYLTPIYDLGYSQPGADFLADEGDDPISLERVAIKDHFNVHPVEWTNPSPDRPAIDGTTLSEPFAAYQPQLEEGTPDPIDVAAYGTRKAEPTRLRCILSKGHAAEIANQLATRSITSRNTYSFRLGWRFAALEPCDLVTLTDATLGLSRRLVRITEITEDASGAFDVRAEEVGTVAVAAAALYTLS